MVVDGEIVTLMAVVPTAGKTEVASPSSLVSFRLQTMDLFIRLRHLRVCCADCNLAKYDLEAVEYHQLLDLVQQWPAPVRRRFLALLKFGGSAFRPRNKG